MTKFSLTEKRPLIISGPCSAETEEQTLETCRQIAATGLVDVLRAGVWKPRTKPGSFEGVGLPGLAWMARAKAETGLPIAVEVATAKHVESALAFGVDILWVGARTTVNPFSVQDICDALRGTDTVVLVKNPMNPDINLWVGAVERLRKVGIENIGLIHRGFSAVGGIYRNNPMWHLAIEMQHRMPELPIIGDPSHIAGKREYLAEVAQKCADLNFNGLIVESHICPQEAWSDPEQQLVPSDLVTLLNSIHWRKEKVDKPEFVQALDGFRAEIDQIDAEVFDLLSRRMVVAESIGQVKRDNDVTILQSGRWSDIVDRILAQSDQLKLSKEFISIILNAIHMESISKQNQVMNAR
ncbi:MAG: bifunctional 3-deoxy-7-phosphoheptulonate synthase/chorismate mutase type II [Rikenellaceae bacterium]|jgi:chorismate mutase|nr:bifunctional 3-deoxy-7-phosphoheptulonate synthase/chorismate mutase type II [Rikenellaceae bacterium]